MTIINESIQKELDKMESLHKEQVKIGRHYFWEAEDDALHAYWQEQADQTKARIIAFKKEHNITTKNWWK